MTICKNHRPEDPFARIDKFLINDSSITWKAKAILCYAFSRPDDWEFYQGEIGSHAADGKAATKSGIKELEEAGYLHRIKKNSKTGRFEYEWHWFSRPVTDKQFQKMFPETDFPPVVKPPLVKPSLESSTLDKSDTTKKEEETKNDLNKNEEEREGGKPPAPPPAPSKSSSKPSEKKIERAPHVHTTEDEHQKLSEAPYSPKMRDEAYEALSDWKCDTARSKWKKSDFRSIKRWVFDSIKEKKLKGTRGKSRANPNISEAQAAQYDGLF